MSGFGYNAERTGSGDKEGTVLTYVCHVGYEIASDLTTSRNITCTQSGDWDFPPAYCQSKSDNDLFFCENHVNININYPSNQKIIVWISIHLPMFILLPSKTDG